MERKGKAWKEEERKENRIGKKMANPLSFMRFHSKIQDKIHIHINDET